MNANEIKGISKDKFTFVNRDESIHDEKFETKPIGYFKDAWYRFSRNKGSVVAAVIILILMMFALLVPIFSKFTVKYVDGYYKYAMPKSEFFSQFGFWDGKTVMKGVNQANYDYYSAIPGAVTKVIRTYEKEVNKRTDVYYDIEIDTYKKVGYVYMFLTEAELNDVYKYQNETGKQLMYPLIDINKMSNPSFEADANVWYSHTAKGAAKKDENGNFVDIYMKDSESPDGYKYVQSKQNGAQYQIRVNYYDWYEYKNGFEPAFLFGADSYGKDILVCLASGARLSFILAISVSAINFIIGTCIGAAEGYYGGKLDMIVERLIEILNGIPFVIVATLFQMYFVRKVGAIGSLLFAFVLTGWIGVAGRVRSQFYRYKGQEYVLAARTLGAKDRRIIFRHILPNALGTVITSAALMIPSVILSESVLAFLGIVDLQTSNITSVGTLLSNGQSALTSYPHALFFPAGFISILMICFNMFGNGLRDAFNPSLRGAE